MTGYVSPIGTPRCPDYGHRESRHRGFLARGDSGFTMVELLVVVLIVGILAGVALPSFLTQRDRARRAQLVSDLRNAANSLEIFATENGGTYDPAALDDFHPTAGVVTVEEIGAGGTTYCLTATIAGFESRSYDSTDGLLPDGVDCP